MITYNIFITALVPDYHDHIIAGMVKLGYMIGPIVDNTMMHSINSPSCLITIRADSKKEDGKILTVYGDITSILKSISAKYYSIIISGNGSLTWNGSNFSLPTKDADKP